MTSKMQSCVDHIKTSCDVDPWAMELVEQVFEEYDERFDKVLEIIDKQQIIANHGDAVDAGINSACNYIRAEVERLKGEQQ